MEKIIILMYTCAAFVNMVSFLPQVFTLLRDRTRSSSISLQTQSMWMYTVTSGVLYAYIVMGDPVFMLAATVTFIGCSSVTLLTVFNRIKGRMFGMEGQSIADVFAKTSVGQRYVSWKNTAALCVAEPQTARADGRVWGGVAVILGISVFFPAL